MTMRIRYYINEEGTKPIGGFDSEESCREWWSKNKLSPWSSNLLIEVSTDVEAFTKAVEESTKRNQI